VLRKYVFLCYVQCFSVLRRYIYFLCYTHISLFHIPVWTLFEIFVCCLHVLLLLTCLFLPFQSCFQFHFNPCTNQNGAVNKRRVRKEVQQALKERKEDGDDNIEIPVLKESPKKKTKQSSLRLTNQISSVFCHRSVVICHFFWNDLITCLM